MKVKRLHHVGIAVADLAAAHEILSGKLDLPVVRDFTAPNGNVARFYGVGDGEFEVVQYPPAEAPKRLEGATARIDHIAVEIDDLETTKAALDALGIVTFRQSAPTGESVRTDKVTSAGIAIQFIKPAEQKG